LKFCQIWRIIAAHELTLRKTGGGHLNVDKTPQLLRLEMVMRRVASDY